MMDANAAVQAEKHFAGIQGLTTGQIIAKQAEELNARRIRDGELLQRTVMAEQLVEKEEAAIRGLIKLGELNRITTKSGLLVLAFSIVTWWLLSVLYSVMEFVFGPVSWFAPVMLLTFVANPVLWALLFVPKWFYRRVR